jgi:hypothetical protein
MALAASKGIIEAYDPAAYREDVPATDSTQYFKGGLVGILQSTGKLVKLTQASVGISAVYICEDEVLTGVGTTTQIGVRTGTFKLLNGDSIVDADRGKRAFVGAAGDDSAFKAGDPITDVLIGTIERVGGATDTGGAGVYVKIRGTQVIVKPLTATTGDNLSGS